VDRTTSPLPTAGTVGLRPKRQFVYNSMDSISKKTVQTLTLADRLFAPLVSGEKTSTIRWREQRIASGPLKFICMDVPSNTADVIVSRCSDMALRDVASFLQRSAEWPDDEMLSSMKDLLRNSLRLTESSPKQIFEIGQSESRVFTAILVLAFFYESTSRRISPGRG